jgi:hypothetical protein
MMIMVLLLLLLSLFCFFLFLRFFHFSFHFVDSGIGCRGGVAVATAAQLSRMLSQMIRLFNERLNAEDPKRLAVDALAVISLPHIPFCFSTLHAPPSP